jgi:hypothetical protein
VTGAQWQANENNETLIVPWLAYENHWLKVSPTEVLTYAPFGPIWLSAGLDIDYGATGSWQQKFISKLAVTMPIVPIQSYVQVKHRTIAAQPGIVLIEGLTASLPLGGGRFGALGAGINVSQISANWLSDEGQSDWQTPVSVNAHYGVQVGAWEAGMQLSQETNETKSGQILVQVGRRW